MEQGAETEVPVELSKSQVTLGYVPAIDIWTAFVAKELGYFEDEGLDVELISMSGGGDVLTALIGGSVDFTTSGANTVWGAVRQGAELKSFVGAELGSIGQIALSKEWAESKGLGDDPDPADYMAALAGARIGTNLPGGSLHAWARLAFEGSGLDPNADLTIEPLDGGAAELAAFEAGRIDGFVHVAPTTNQAQERHGALLLDLNDVTGVPEFAVAPSDLYTTTQAMLDEHPDTVAAMTRAVLRAWRYILDNREAATEILTEYVGELGEGYTDLDFGNLERQGLLLTQESFEAGAVISEFILGEELGLTYDDVIDPTFAEQAYADLGLG